LMASLFLLHTYNVIIQCPSDAAIPTLHFN
jgi:hypothetical protein